VCGRVFGHIRGSDTGKLRWSAEEQQRMVELVDACTVLVDSAVIGGVRAHNSGRCGCDGDYVHPLILQTALFHTQTPATSFMSVRICIESLSQWQRNCTTLSRCPIVIKWC
jgi:hypothetical protein